METPETIRLSLQKGEWVTLLDFSAAYFHIPIAQRSRKFLRFHMNKVNYQFTSLPFGLAMAPLEFTKVVKEVKLMAQARGIRIHQYLDDWLLRAPCQATCLQHTRTLLALCQGLGSKHEKIGTDSSTGFQFRWLPVRPVDRSGLAHSGPVVYPEAKVKIYQGPELLHSQTVHVSDRSPHSDGETSLLKAAFTRGPSSGT